jgi:hypothetical protein
LAEAEEDATVMVTVTQLDLVMEGLEEVVVDAEMILQLTQDKLLLDRETQVEELDLKMITAEAAAEALGRLEEIKEQVQVDAVEMAETV